LAVTAKDFDNLPILAQGFMSNRIVGW
jgi:hypothetical protein